MTMKNAPRIDRETKTIIVTKEFFLKSGQINTVEFSQMIDLKSKFPEYKIEIKKIRSNENKRAYGDLSYEAMADFINGYETENTEQALKELDLIIKRSKAQKAAYVYVKKWFLAKYKDEFNRREEELKRERLEKAEAVTISFANEFATR